MSLLYDLSGLVVMAGGGYCLWYGITALDQSSFSSGLAALLIGLFVFRSGMELVRTGAASRVVARQNRETTAAGESGAVGDAGSGD